MRSSAGDIRCDRQQFQPCGCNVVLRQGFDQFIYVMTAPTQHVRIRLTPLAFFEVPL